MEWTVSAEQMVSPEVREVRPCRGCVSVRRGQLGVSLAGARAVLQAYGGTSIAEPRGLEQRARDRRQRRAFL